MKIYAYFAWPLLRPVRDVAEWIMYSEFSQRIARSCMRHTSASSCRPIREVGFFTCQVLCHCLRRNYGGNPELKSGTERRGIKSSFSVIRTRTMCQL